MSKNLHCEFVKEKKLHCKSPIELASGRVVVTTASVNLLAATSIVVAPAAGRKGGGVDR